MADPKDPNNDPAGETTPPVTPNNTGVTVTEEAPVVATTSAPTGEGAPSAKWLATIQPLVTRLGLNPEVVTKALLDANLVGAAQDADAETLTDPEAVTDDDFAEAFKEAPRGNLRKAVKELREAAAPAAKPTEAAGKAIPNMVGIAPSPVVGFVIPDVADGGALLTALSTSKELRVDETTIRAALEALFADDRSLSNIPEGLAELMERFADTVEEPVGDQFMEVLKLVRERRYAEVHVDSRLVTKARKQTFLQRLRTLPEATLQFHSVLEGWNGLLTSNRSANPFGVLQGGNFYPPPDDVIAASQGVVRCLTRAFAGLGVMVARALAYEALQIREILDRPELLALTGAPNRELMLRNLGCEITDADVRQEKNIAKYVMFIATRVPRDLPGGQEGPVLEALFQLGQQVLPWMRGETVVVARASNGASTPRGRDQRRDPSEPYPVGGHGSRDLMDR